MRGNEIADRIIYPVILKTFNREFLTGYYYTQNADALLNDGDRIMEFGGVGSLRRFCDENELELSDAIAVFDFSEPVDNPVSFSQSLNNWNMLKTISDVLDIYFKGKEKRYNRLYDKLFRLSTCTVVIPDKVWLNEKEIRQLKAVLRKRHQIVRKAFDGKRK